MLSLIAKNSYPKQKTRFEHNTEVTLPLEANGQTQNKYKAKLKRNRNLFKALFYIRFDFSLRQRQQSTQMAFFFLSRACKWAFFPHHSNFETLFISQYIQSDADWRKKSLRILVLSSSSWFCGCVRFLIADRYFTESYVAGGSFHETSSISQTRAITKFLCFFQAKIGVTNRRSIFAL